jgi:hypothetical protein
LTGGTPIPPPPGQTAPNFKGAIGVTADSVEGVDITVPVYHFAETHYLADAVVTLAYKLTLFALTGRVNNSAFKGFAAGECLFLGAAGTKRGSGDWEVGYRFAFSPNVTGLTVGDITGINKKDSHLCVRYADCDALLRWSRPSSENGLEELDRCPGLNENEPFAAETELAGNAKHTIAHVPTGRNAACEVPLRAIGEPNGVNIDNRRDGRVDSDGLQLNLDGNPAPNMNQFVRVLKREFLPICLEKKSVTGREPIELLSLCRRWREGQGPDRQVFEHKHPV